MASGQRFFGTLAPQKGDSLNFATLTFRFLGSLDHNISLDSWAALTTTFRFLTVVVISGFKSGFASLVLGFALGAGITLRGRNCHVVYKPSRNAIE